MAFYMGYITHPDQATANRIGRCLVEEKLAACANVFSIRSHYWWQQTIESEDEWVSLVKTTSEKWKALEARVKELHPYEVPCIINWEVNANQAYEDWVKESVGG